MSEIAYYTHLTVLALIRYTAYSICHDACPRMLCLKSLIIGVSQVTFLKTLYGGFRHESFAKDVGGFKHGAKYNLYPLLFSFTMYI